MLSSARIPAGVDRRVSTHTSGRSTGRHNRIKGTVTSGFTADEHRHIVEWPDGPRLGEKPSR